MPDMLNTSNRMLGSAQNDGLRVALQFLGAVIRKGGKVAAAAAVDAGCVPVLVSVTGGSDNREKARVGMEKEITIGAGELFCVVKQDFTSKSSTTGLGLVLL